jgi:O-antigen/teichoic acid export membrane protein
VTAEPLGRRIARGLFTLAAGRAVVMGLQFTTIALLASHLGPAGLGVYAFGVAAATLFKILPNFGTVQVVTRDIAQAPERERDLLPNLIYLRLGIGVASYGLLVATMVLLGFEDENRRAAYIAGLVLIIAFDAFRSALEVRLRLGWVSIADTVEAAVTVLATIALVRGDAGVESFLWLYVALKLVNAVIVTIAALRMGTFSWRPLPRSWAAVLRVSLPLGVAGVLMALYFRIDIVILARLQPAADVGQYGAAYRFLEVFTVVPAIAMSVLAPVLARSVVEGAAVLQRRYAQAVHLVAVLSLGVAVVGAMTAWRVLPALPGFDAFDGGGVALSILAPAAGLILVGTVVQGTLVSGHLQRYLLRLSAIGLGCNVALNVALIPRFSYLGAAAATTVTEAVLVALSIREVRRRLGLRWPAQRLVPAAAAGGASAVVLAAGYLVNPFLQLGAGAVTYAAVTFLAGALRRADVRPFLPDRLGGAAR